MERFINAIRTSVKNENWLAAVFMALTMPDICSAVQNPFNRKVGIRYTEWYDRYFKGVYKVGLVTFTAQDCYQFRCRCLHEGIARKKDDEHFNLTPPIKGLPIEIHLNDINGVIQLQIDIFCEDMCRAVESWVKAMEPYPAVRERMKELIEIKFPPGFI